MPCRRNLYIEWHFVDKDICFEIFWLHVKMQMPSNYKSNETKFHGMNDLVFVILNVNSIPTPHKYYKMYVSYLCVNSEISRNILKTFHVEIVDDKSHFFPFCHCFDKIYYTLFSKQQCFL